MLPQVFTYFPCKRLAWFFKLSHSFKSLEHWPLKPVCRGHLRLIKPAESSMLQIMWEKIEDINSCGFTNLACRSLHVWNHLSNTFGPDQNKKGARFCSTHETELQDNSHYIIFDCTSKNKWDELISSFSQLLYIVYSTAMVAIVVTLVTDYRDVSEFAALQFPISTLVRLSSFQPVITRLSLSHILVIKLQYSGNAKGVSKAKLSFLSGEEDYGSID